MLPDLPSLLFQENPKQSKKNSVSEIIIIATKALADLFRPGFCTERDESSKIIRLFVSHLHLFQHYSTHFTVNPLKHNFRPEESSAAPGGFSSRPD